MKKILTIAVAMLLAQTMLMAQKAKDVAEKDVPVRYVKDFQHQAPDAKSVGWQMIDSTVYEASFVNNNGTRQAFRFTPRGMETRYYVDAKWYPHAIKDTVAHHYPKHKITSIYTRTVKNKTTYQARIAKKQGFLVKKEKEVKLLNFETSGKYIDEEK